MATLLPGTGVCTDCGNLALCLNCNRRVREANAIVERLAGFSVGHARSPEERMRLRELIKRARRYVDKEPA